MKSESVSEPVLCAIETYDHLLWQAVIKVCRIALSRSFRRDGNQVRVVYTTFDRVDGVIDLDNPVDPRNQFSEIKAMVEELIDWHLSIKKLGQVQRSISEARKLCSHYSYEKFLIDKVVDPNTTQTDLDFVRIGSFVELPAHIDALRWSAYICCPCVGRHLENTRQLWDFVINLQPPKRVGKNTHEFRFEVSD